MSSYRGSTGKPDRAKAIAAVAAVHVALAFAILSGLNVQKSWRRAEEPTTTIDIKAARPPVEARRPKPVPRPMPRPRAREKPREAPAEPRPMAAPTPQSRVPARPGPAAAIPAAGAAATSGASTSGAGTGSRGSGTGSGTGTGDYSRFTPARLISNIPNSQYARLAATGIPSGAVGVTILVDTAGGVSNCRVVRSSGEQSVDALVCQLTERYVRFEPARDPYGRPVAQDITYFPSWRRR